MKIILFGHPYAPIGMGEQLASFSNALDAVYVEHKIYNIYGGNSGEIRKELLEKEIDDPNWGDVRIFHINGDEIEPCLQHLQNKGFDFHKGINIIVPAWELQIYPEIWRESINKFDEIWAISKYVENIFTSSWVKPKVKYVGQSAERRYGLHYPRNYFGIKNSSLVFLSFFDQSSYFTRKNPSAVIKLYKELRKLHKYADFQLVLKTKNINKSADLNVDDLDENIIFINENLSYDEITSLIDCCDVFVSLHRAEGFGRGAAEAVLRGKRAIVTNFSGVKDYSDDLAIIPVSYKLIDVKEGEYPFYQNQKWAEPDIEEAITKASILIDEFERGYINEKFFYENEEAGNIVYDVASNFAVGYNIIKNLKEISKV